MKHLRSPLSADKHVLKIALVGFHGIGRTSILTRMASGFFAENTKYSVDDEVSSVFNYYPPTGSEECLAIQLFVPNIKTDSKISDMPWFKSIAGFFVCFDLTDYASFADLEGTRWFPVRTSPTGSVFFTH